jgi:hypothetical protein
MIAIALLLLWGSLAQSEDIEIIYIECHPGKAYYISDYLEELLVIERVQYRLHVEAEDVIILTLSCSCAPKVEHLLDSLPHYIKQYKLAR